MQRTYGNRPQTAQIQPKQPEFVPKQRSKEELRHWESTFNLIHLLLKSHNRQTTSFCWGKLKKYYLIKKKYASFLSNKLHLLQKRKSRQYLKLSLSALQSNRINYYTTKREENAKLKENLKNKATVLINIISTKLEKSKIHSYFQCLRVRSQLKSKMTSFKNTHLFSRLSNIYQNKLKQAFAKIDQYGKKKLRNLRQLSRVEKLVSTKNKNLLSFSILRLKLNVLQIRAKQSQEKQEKVAVENEAKFIKKTTAPIPPVVSPSRDKELQAEIRNLQNQQRNLNEKKKTVEKQLNKIETQSQKALNDFKKEIERLERQNSQLVFNNDLLEHNNQQLEKQFQNRQKSSRKKLSKAEIWENVYNNLIHFLTINKDKEISKAALLQCLELPLVPCNINIDQINDQNKILSELLEQYKKNFPAPQIMEVQPELLPFEIIRKQNRYYYMVLEVLSEWGMTGSKQLEQLNKDLATLQKKLTS